MERGCRSNRLPATAVLVVLSMLSALSCAREEHLPVGPLTRQLLAVDGARDSSAALDELAFVAGRVRAAMARQPALAPAEQLRQVVFDELGFVREVEDQDARFTLLASVLSSRRGNCVGLGSLYLALGERLGLPMAGVLVPGHFFVRVTDTRGNHNVELLHGGHEQPDAWYRRKYGVPDGGPSAYLTPLTQPQVLAVVHYNLGNAARSAGRIREAKAHYARAAANFPLFAEAHASLGLVLHLLGNLDAAEHEYLAARSANPALPGLDQNLALLHTEHGIPDLTQPSSIR